MNRLMINLNYESKLNKITKIMINIKTLTHTHILDIEINYTSVYLNCTENVNERIIDEHRKKRKTLQLKIDKTENLIYFYINLIKKRK